MLEIKGICQFALHLLLFAKLTGADDAENDESTKRQEPEIQVVVGDSGREQLNKGSVVEEKIIEQGIGKPDTQAERTGYQNNFDLFFHGRRDWHL